jgi:ABC-type sugar transport system ATPase subunit
MITDSKTVFALENITTRYPGVPALNTGSFERKEVEVHALVRENEAGKYVYPIFNPLLEFVHQVIGNT